MSFIEIAFAGQFISQPNTQLLLRELRALSIHMQHRHQDIVATIAKKNDSYQDTSLEQFFQDTASSIAPSRTRPGHTKESPASSTPSTSENQQDTTPASTPVDDSSSAGMTPDNPLSARDERKEHIIAVITYKHTASIKDIVTHITGCSEKTLQRDIKELIAEGRIIKEGSRRWTTYRIKE